jgi:hypothetical protein
MEVSEKDRILARLNVIDQEIDDMKAKKMSYSKIRHRMFERLDLVFALQRLSLIEKVKDLGKPQ